MSAGVVVYDSCILDVNICKPTEHCCLAIQSECFYFNFHTSLKMSSLVILFEQIEKKDEKPPVTTVFVGNISDRAPDSMIRQMLQVRTYINCACSWGKKLEFGG